MANTTGDIRTVDEILGDEVQLALKAGRPYITLSFSCVEKLTKQWKDKLQEVWELQELNEHLIDRQKLLKEHEPIKPTINEYGMAYCVCGENVGIIPNSKNLPKIRSKYCSECGRRMKWE